VSQNTWLIDQRLSASTEDIALAITSVESTEGLGHKGGSLPVIASRVLHLEAWILKARSDQRFSIGAMHVALMSNVAG
jgi:hypothetical protein